MTFIPCQIECATCTLFQANQGQIKATKKAMYDLETPTNRFFGSNIVDVAILMVAFGPRVHTRVLHSVMNALLMRWSSFNNAHVDSTLIEMVLHRSRHNNTDTQESGELNSYHFLGRYNIETTDLGELNPYQDLGIAGALSKRWVSAEWANFQETQKTVLLITVHFWVTTAEK